MPVGVDTRDVQALRRRMRQRGERLSNVRGANLAAAVQIQAWTQRNLEAEGGLHDAGSLRWPDLARSTKRQRRRIGKWPGKMLQVTGRLAGAFETGASRRFGWVRNRTRYAAFHEEGTSRMPQRKIFPERGQAVDIALPAYRKFVTRSIR